MADDEGSREARVAKNEVLFREVNERIEELAVFQDPRVARVQLVCECANLECAALVELTTSEYEAVRADPRRFVVAPGEAHLDGEADRVLERHERYWLVEKIGDAADVAEESDPRAEPEVS